MSKKLVVKVNGNPYEVELGDLSKNPVKVHVNGKSYEVDFEAEAKATPAAEPKKKATAPASATPAPAAAAAGAGTLTAPMPGKIIDVNVKAGDKLTAGQPVCSLEAMKMKNIIRSPRAGIVKSVEVTAGQKVAYGTVIIRYA